MLENSGEPAFFRGVKLVMIGRYYISQLLFGQVRPTSRAELLAVNNFNCFLAPYESNKFITKGYANDRY